MKRMKIGPVGVKMAFQAISQGMAVSNEEIVSIMAILPKLRALLRPHKDAIANLEVMDLVNEDFFEAAEKLEEEKLILELEDAPYAFFRGRVSALQYRACWASQLHALREAVENAEDISEE